MTEEIEDSLKEMENLLGRKLTDKETEAVERYDVLRAYAEMIWWYVENEEDFELSEIIREMENEY